MVTSVVVVIQIETANSCRPPTERQTPYFLPLNLGELVGPLSIGEMTQGYKWPTARFTGPWCWQPTQPDIIMSGLNRPVRGGSSPACKVCLISIFMRFHRLKKRTTPTKKSGSSLSAMK